MNKKGFSILELIAVLVIITSLLLIVFPKSNEKSEEIKQNEYLKEVKDMVDNAKIMYQDSKYLNDTNYFTKENNVYLIKLGKIVGMTDYVDPHGYLFDKEQTVIKFLNGGKDIIVNVISCDTNMSDNLRKCYEIVDENYDNLTDKSIKNTVH